MSSQRHIAEPAHAQIMRPHTPSPQRTNRPSKLRCRLHLPVALLKVAGHECPGAPRGAVDAVDLLRVLMLHTRCAHHALMIIHHAVLAFFAAEFSDHYTQCEESHAVSTCPGKHLSRHGDVLSRLLHTDRSRKHPVGQPIEAATGSIQCVNLVPGDSASHPCSCRTMPCAYSCFDVQDKVRTMCTGCRDWYS